jgi:hypothetical protein
VGDGAATLVGHGPGPAPPPAPAAPPAAAPAPRKRPAPDTARTGAAAKQPETFALPTPAGAPLAPRQTPPQVAVYPPSSVPAPQAPAAPGPAAQANTAAAISGALPTPARVELAGAMDRARTAPPGQFMLQAVSLKPQPDPAAPPPPAPEETPEVPRVKLRPIADAAPRTYSVAPGSLGNLAPPKAQADAARAAARTRTLLIIAIALVVATLAGVIAAVAL